MAVDNTILDLKKIRLLFVAVTSVTLIVSCSHTGDVTGSVEGDLKKITVAKGHWQGKNGYDLNNGNLAVTVLPGEGGRIIEITDCKTGREIIQAPNDKTAIKHGQYDRTLGLNKAVWVLAPLKDNPLGAELTAESDVGIKAKKTIILDGNYPVIDFYWELSNSTGRTAEFKINSLFQFNKVKGTTLQEVPSEAGFQFTHGFKDILDEIFGGYQHEDGKFIFKKGPHTDVTKRTLIYLSKKYGYAFVFIPVNAKEIFANSTYHKYNYYHLVIQGKPVKLYPGSKINYHYRFVYVRDENSLDDIPPGKLGVDEDEGESVVEAIKKELKAKPKIKLEFKPEQLKILKQGVELWNDWRKRNPGTKVCLSGVDLKRELPSLTGYDLHDANLAMCNLYYYNMTKANFDGANFSRCFFGGTNYSESTFKNANFRLSNPYNGLFRQADVSGANFSLTSGYKVRFYETNMAGTSFIGAYLKQCEIKNCELKNTNFSYANLTDAKIVGNKYGTVIFKGANVENATLDVSLKPILEKAEKVYGLKTVKWVEEN